MLLKKNTVESVYFVER